MNDDTFQQLLHYMTAGPTAGDLPQGEAAAAKDRIGQTIADLVVAKTAADIVTANAEAIVKAANGDKSIARYCALFQADCEAKLVRITEGWDTDPADTEFRSSRERLVATLKQSRDAAEKIREITDGLLHVFEIPEEERP
jgi:hypothetical protein